MRTSVTDKHRVLAHLTWIPRLRTSRRNNRAQVYRVCFLSAQFLSPYIFKLLNSPRARIVGLQWIVDEIRPAVSFPYQSHVQLSSTGSTGRSMSSESTDSSPVCEQQLPAQGSREMINKNIDMDFGTDDLGMDFGLNMASVTNKSSSPPVSYPGPQLPPLLPQLYPQLVDDQLAKYPPKVVRFTSPAKSKQEAASWYRSLSFRTKNRPVVDYVNEAGISVQNPPTSAGVTLLNSPLIVGLQRIVDETRPAVSFPSRNHAQSSSSRSMSEPSPTREQQLPLQDSREMKINMDMEFEMDDLGMNFGLNITNNSSSSPPAPYPGPQSSPFLPALYPQFGDDRPAKFPPKIVTFPSLAKKTRQHAASWYRSMNFQKKNRRLVNEAGVSVQNPPNSRGNMELEDIFTDDDDDFTLFNGS